jgi:hypothetical protein
VLPDCHSDNPPLRWWVAASETRPTDYVTSPVTQAFAASSCARGNTRASPGIIHANSRVARAIHSMSVTIAERTQLVVVLTLDLARRAEPTVPVGMPDSRSITASMFPQGGEFP